MSFGRKTAYHVAVLLHFALLFSVLPCSMFDIVLLRLPFYSAQAVTPPDATLQPSSDEAFWAAVAAQHVAEGSNTSSWKQTEGSKSAASGGGKRGGGKGAGSVNDHCALCTDKSPGRWITRCKGPGGGTRQQPCSVWVHPACAWQV